MTPRAANIQRLGPQIAVTKAATKPPVFTLVPGSVTVPATSPPGANATEAAAMATDSVTGGPAITECAREFL